MEGKPVGTTQGVSTDMNSHAVSSARRFCVLAELPRRRRRSLPTAVGTQRSAQRRTGRRRRRSTSAGCRSTCAESSVSSGRARFARSATVELRYFVDVYARAPQHRALHQGRQPRIRPGAVRRADAPRDAGMMTPREYRNHGGREHSRRPRPATIGVSQVCDPPMRILVVSATPPEIAPLVGRLRRVSDTGLRSVSYRFGEHDVDVLTTGVGMVATAAWCSRALRSASTTIWR